MYDIPTVKICWGDSYCIINESDFDDKKHTLYDENKKIELKPVKEPTKKATKRKKKVE